MADPVSFVAAGVGIIDVCVRVIRYLQDAKAARDAFETDITNLITEIQTLLGVHGELEQEFLKNVRNDGLGAEEKMLWFHTGKTLQEGQKLTKRLEDCVKQVFGDDPSITGLREGYLKSRRLRNKGSVISGLRAQISNHQGALQMWLTFISRHSTEGHHEAQTSMLVELTTVIKGLESKLSAIQDTQPPHYDSLISPPTYSDFTSASMSVLKQMSASMNTIEITLTQPSAVVNKHFDIPRPVDQFYTGRQKEAEALERWMFSKDASRENKSYKVQSAMQKRFVVCGMGGSGKTQFCSKFAQDHRESFWGVFWVDGSSEERLKQTYSNNISKLVGVEGNEKAALHWLANTTERWLLIVDNADNLDVEIESHLPIGNRGYVLITTRSQPNRKLGNIGPGSFDFQGLVDEEATCLLFKTAGEKQPWDSALFKAAKEIANVLGYLAIAIAQAGSTIRERLCKFTEYIKYYERQWQKTRQRRQTIKSHDSGDELKVYTSFDLNLQAITARQTEVTRDALQLLNIFAFFDRQNIRFDFLERSITNAKLEEEQVRTEVKGGQMHDNNSASSWSVSWKSIMVTVFTYMYKSRGPETLPNVIRHGRSSAEFDPDRLRAALRHLALGSLVAHNDRTDSYSLHPLVHKWARERPDLSAVEQSVWCAAAGKVLSHCLLLPPLGSTIQDEEIRRDILPHIDHVQNCQKSIEQRMRDNRIARMKPWPIFENGFDRDKALMYAKFSTVYLHNGRWEEAKRLQFAVRNFTMKVLGLEDSKTRRITTALASTLVELTQCDDAAALQKELLEACDCMFGPDHHETLLAKLALAESRFVQGRFSDAIKLQEEGLAGLEKLHGVEHEDTLVAMDNLGRTLTLFRTEEALRRARQLHLGAIKGMEKVHGEQHLLTLRARERLCACAVESGIQAHIEESHEIMVDVFETRKGKLGKEHPYTLLSMVVLALVKSALRQFQGAEDLIKMALPIAERNLGTGHHGYLWGRYQLGRIWIQQERWEEAEHQLLDVTERQRTLLQGRGEVHPDRIGGLFELATVYNALGKHDDCKRVANEALEGLDKISTKEHPVAIKLRRNLAEWEKARINGGDG